MPDVPTPTPANTEPAAASPAKAVTPDAKAPVPVESKRPVLAIALGALSLVLLISFVLVWSTVGDRNDTIAQTQNRLAQNQAEYLVIQHQLADAQGATTRAQKRL